MGVRPNLGLSFRPTNWGAFIDGLNVDCDSNGSVLVALGLCFSLVVPSGNDPALPNVYITSVQ